jgi:hypothetical protein
MLDATVSMSFAVDVREEFTFAFSEWKSFVVVLVASDDVFFFLFLVVLRFRVSFREIIDVFRVANNIVFAAHKGKGKATKSLKTKPKKILLVCLLFNDDTMVTLYDDVCFLIISLFTLYSLSL